MGDPITQIGSDSWQQWGDRISAAWQKAVEAIVETGQLLIDAKADLKHGTFEAMVRCRLPFTPSTARRLMAIAEHPIISNRAHAHVLPPSWGTLYELTKLPSPLLAARIKDRSITPGLERKDVPKLRDEEPPHLTVNGQPVGRPPTRSQKLAQANAQLQEDLERFRRAGDDLFSPSDSAADIARLLAARLLRVTPSKAGEVLKQLPLVYTQLTAEREDDLVDVAAGARKPTREPARKRRSAAKHTGAEAAS